MKRRNIIVISSLFAFFIAAIASAAENKENVFITTQSFEAVKVGDCKTQILWEARVFNNNDHTVHVVIEARIYCRTGSSNSILGRDTSAFTLAPKEAKTQSETFCANELIKDAIEDSMPLDLVVEIKDVIIEPEKKEDVPK